MKKGIRFSSDDIRREIAQLSQISDHILDHMLEWDKISQEILPQLSLEQKKEIYEIGKSFQLLYEEIEHKKSVLTRVFDVYFYCEEKNIRMVQALSEQSSFCPQQKREKNSIMDKWNGKIYCRILSDKKMIMEDWFYSRLQQYVLRQRD